MEIVKKYIIWVILGAIMLVLLGVQFVLVGGRRTAVATENEEIITRIDAFANFNSKVTKEYPTKGDLSSGGKHLEKIKAEERNVALRWNHYTGGLNVMFKGKYIYELAEDKKTQKVIEADIFSDFIRKKYLNLFIGTEKKLAKLMKPQWEIMLAEDKYAKDPTLKTLEEAAGLVKTKAANVARAYAHVFEPGKLIPVNQNKQFQDNAPEEMWQVWRSYLITEDIMNNLASTIVEVKREVAVIDRQKADTTEEEDLIQKTTAKTVGGWRIVENISELEVSGPAIGNVILPDPTGSKADVEDDEGVEDPDDDDDEDFNEGAEENAEDDKQRYYDVFTVKLTMVAHPKIVEKFMHDILQNEKIFYIPVGVSIKTIEEQKIMGNYNPVYEQQRFAPGGTDYDTQKAVEPNVTAGFEHQPSVEATLIYNVYRFRFAGNMNQKTSLNTID